MPANKYALSDPYFTTCEDDLYDKSRCISANQLKKLNNTTFNEKYKKEINEVINKTLEEILLNPNTKEDDIVQKVDNLSVTGTINRVVEFIDEKRMDVDKNNDMALKREK